MPAKSFDYRESQKEPFIKSIFTNKNVRNRILFTLVIFFIYRLGSEIPVPNIDLDSIGETSGLISMMNLLGGGAMDNMSIFALGLTPYITASIIIQLLSMDVIPPLTELAKSGKKGKRKLDKYTRYLALVLCFVQSYTMTLALSDGSDSILINSDFSGYLYVSTVFTAGTMFLLWLADRISMYGIGNGVSMIIFAGIVADIPYEFAEAFSTLTAGTSGSALFNGVLTFIGFILIYLLIIVLVVFMTKAERRLPLQFTNSTNASQNNEKQYLPLKINSASVIPVIFANAVMLAPVQIITIGINYDWFDSSTVTDTLYNLLQMESVESLVIYAVLIILFTFFYTKLQVDPEKIAQNLKDANVYIPPIPPGKETEKYINTVLSRITVLGALFLTVIALLPNVAPMIITSLPSSIRLGGTGIIIVVGVAIETSDQIRGLVNQKKSRGFGFRNGEDPFGRKVK